MNDLLTQAYEYHKRCEAHGKTPSHAKSLKEYMKEQEDKKGV